MGRRGKGGPKKSVSSKGAEFFKVFLPHLSNHRIMISPDFVKDFKRTISEKAVLKDVCGKEWHVYVKETPDGVFFLENGWKSYVDYHCLKMGEFLVFRYDGAYSFMVKIFGTNGCKKKKDLDSTRVKIEDKSEDEMTEEPTCRKRPREDPSLIAYNTQQSERFEQMKESEEQNVASECPFFISAETKGKYILRIPDEVINEHNLKLETEMVLRNENGKEWPVHIFPHKGATFIGKKWHAFQVDNNVGSNDRCKFTFDNKRSICRTINVQILRSGQDPSPKRTLKRGRGRPKKIANDDNFWVQVTKNPSDEKVPYSDKLPEFFKIYVPGICSETMGIPPDFINEFGENIPTICTLENPSGLSWKVDMNRVDDHWFFQNGWPEFVDENSLQDHDFLTFAYARNATFYVKVYSCNGCLKMPEKIDDETAENLQENEASQQETPKNRRNTRRSTRTTTENLLNTEASQQVHAETPKNGRATKSGTRTKSSIERKSVNGNPSFERVITKSYLKNLYLNIPRQFWIVHMSRRIEMVTLWTKNKWWNIIMRDTGDRIILSGGISNLFRTYSLRIGSICTFELIDSNKLVFNVTIDR